MGRIHHRQQLDEDQREIRLMQEAFLEDGELHSDNTRNRKFRWKNVVSFLCLTFFCEHRKLNSNRCDLIFGGYTLFLAIINLLKIENICSWMLCELVKWLGTGKYLSEALILASTNPQYDNRLFIELWVQYMKIPSSEHVENMLCTQIVFLFLFWYLK